MYKEVNANSVSHVEAVLNVAQAASSCVEIFCRAQNGLVGAHAHATSLEQGVHHASAALDVLLHSTRSADLSMLLSTCTATMRSAARSQQLAAS